VTTNVDGVKRASEGLVRVSAVQEDGLFAKSHPLNRLRVGSIVLTVNGLPVTNGRKALEMVMGSRQLVEVLHVDERAWREDYIVCSLREVEGTKREGDYIRQLVFGKVEREPCEEWKMEWDREKERVVLRKESCDWTFCLIFNGGGAGNCRCDEAEGRGLPPMDEFDVSYLVRLVNEKQRAIMQVLRSMLSRAKYELQFGGLLKSSRLGMVSVGSSHKFEEEDDDRRSNAKYRRKMSYDAVHTMLMKDDEESVDEEMCNLVNDLLRVDDRDRHRKRQPQDDIGSGRRGSTGHIELLTSANFDAKDLEAWYLANMGNGVSNSDKLQWIHSRRKRMDERNNRTLDQSTRSNTSAISMFSAGMLDDFFEDHALDGLGTASDSDPSFATNKRGDDGSEASPESPRFDDSLDKKLLAPKTKSKGSETSGIHTEEKKADEQSAYITGVFRDVATKYKVSDVVVGSGGFGEVRECSDKKTGHTHVVKTITKPPVDDTSKINLIRNEILLLHEAKHPNIVELKDLFEDSKCVHIVMEKCTGGDLFDRVVNENPARIRHRAEAIKHESRTANTMRSIMQVIKYLHSKGIGELHCF
jgi:hypothetical protein